MAIYGPKMRRSTKRLHKTEHITNKPKKTRRLNDAQQARLSQTVSKQISNARPSTPASGRQHGIDTSKQKKTRRSTNAIQRNFNLRPRRKINIGGNNMSLAQAPSKFSTGNSKRKNKRSTYVTQKQFNACFTVIQKQFDDKYEKVLLRLIAIEQKINGPMANAN